MKKIILIMLVLIISFACSKKEDNTKKSENKKIRIVTTLFPTYDFSKEIGKDKVEVKLLLPPGIEAHSYEPTPKDIAEINNADIFIYTGDLMEPWVKKLLSSLNNKNLKIVDVSKNIELKEFDFEDEHNEKDTHENEEEHIHGKDPHIWTDPILAKTIVQNIADSIIEVDLANKSFYDGNKIIYDKKLDNLDTEFKNLVKKSAKKEIVSGGHFVFGYLFERYGLTYHSAYEGFSPNAEPTPKQLKSLKETIAETHTKYIYYEELIEPKLAKLLSNELGLQLLLLHGAHNISKEELAKGTSYYEIMLKNIENLKLGLDYNE
ncbi:MAG: zinc ABC transporter substrate-binding protein [Fusobacteriaceae bacterium]|nr:zinc ABC transporter substrate-binding protein [Fusobacteriaceae bacterium]